MGHDIQEIERILKIVDSGKFNPESINVPDEVKSRLGFGSSVCNDMGCSAPIVPRLSFVDNKDNPYTPVDGCKGIDAHLMHDLRRSVVGMKCEDCKILFITGDEDC